MWSWIRLTPWYDIDFRKETGGYQMRAHSSTWLIYGICLLVMLIFAVHHDPPIVFLLALACFTYAVATTYKTDQKITAELIAHAKAVKQLK